MPATLSCPSPDMRPAAHATGLPRTFLVTGDHRAGTSIVQSSIHAHPKAACHADLLHEDDRIRRESHEAYFGPVGSKGGAVEWYTSGSNPCRYLAHTVLGRPLDGERAVGLRVPYGRIRDLELYDLITSQCATGRFTLVHVVRNPVACFVSLKQAQATRVWRQPRNAKLGADCPAALSLPADELTAFIRNHDAMRTRIRRCCRRVVEVAYRDLYFDYEASMGRIYAALGLVGPPEPSAYRRLRNRGIRDRVRNWAELRRVLPSGVRDALDREDLF